MPRHYMTDNGPIPFTPEEETEQDAKEAAWAAFESIKKVEQIRQGRNAKLAASDWTQLPDCALDKQAWATYRQALRDVPSQSGFPDNIVWPVPPT